MVVQTYSIDDLIDIQGVAFPNHIKLDVDGIEPLILSGAKKTLADVRLKSVMVEVNEQDTEVTCSIVSLLMEHGFLEPVKRHAPYYEENHYLPFGNYLFKRAY